MTQESLRGRVSWAENWAQTVRAGSHLINLWIRDVYLEPVGPSSPPLMDRMLCLYLNMRFPREERSMELIRFPKESKVKSRLKINILVVQTGKLGLRRIKSLTSGHSACNWQAKVLPECMSLVPCGSVSGAQSCLRLG